MIYAREAATFLIQPIAKNRDQSSQSFVDNQSLFALPNFDSRPSHEFHFCLIDPGE